MKIVFLFFLMTLSVNADLLSEADREALRDKIAELEKDAKPKLTQRINTAISELKKAVQSDQATISLHLNCVEKHLFEKQYKKIGDFRDWKKRHERRLTDPNFIRALRHRYQWLLLTIQASQLEAKARAVLPEQALNSLTALVRDAKLIMPIEANTPRHTHFQHTKPLSTSVFEDVVADYFGVNKIQIKNWPLSPLPISAVYDKVILPPLRDPDKIQPLSSAWQNRLKAEKLLAAGQFFGENRDPEHKPSGNYDRFLSETGPNLIWEMEQDLYEAGDQRQATLRMYKHIQNHPTHPSSLNWLQRLKQIVDDDTPTPGVKKSVTAQ